MWKHQRAFSHVVQCLGRARNAKRYLATRVFTVDPHRLLRSRSALLGTSLGAGIIFCRPRHLHLEAQTSDNANARNTAMCRVMLPADANVAGNVHGGTILRLIDEAGSIAATRHANSGTTRGSYVALARIEKMDFVAPMFVGELALLDAEVTFCSDRSCEVLIDVSAENLQTGVRRRTNQARLWFIVTDGKVDKLVEPAGLKCFRTLPVPALRLEAEELAKARERWNRQKADRRAEAILSSFSDTAHHDHDASLLQVMLPGDVTEGGFVQAGVILKLMDNCAGVCAVRYARTNVVTAVLDALDFRAPVFTGSIIKLRARPTFCSSRSMEIEVCVDAENVQTGESYRAVHGFLTFVSLDKNGRPLPLPALPPPTTERQRLLHDAGEQRYLQRKRSRVKG